MAKLRLSPFVAVVRVGSGVSVRSDLKSFALSGEGVADLVRRLLPLLDGSRDVTAIVAAVPDYDADSVRSLLGQLQRLGAVEAADGFPPEVSDGDGLAHFFAAWGKAPGPAIAAVTSAGIAILGLSDWGVRAAESLVRAGVGRLTLFEESGRRRWADPAGHRAPEVARQLAKLGPRTAVTRARVRIVDGTLDFDGAGISLLLVTPPRDELRLLNAVARTAHQRRLRYLVAHLEGLSALLGPIVVPGETACWECLRRRSLANQANAPETARLEAELLAGASAARRRLLPPGAADVLGGLIAMEALKVVADYAPCQLIGRQLELNLVTHASKVHSIVRLPWCPVCGGAADLGSGTPGLGGRDLTTLRDPDELREALAGWVDERTGIVRHLVINHPTPEQPQSVITTTAVIAGFAIPGQHADDPIVGSGKGVGKVGAMIGAVGEAIERYSASHYREADLLRASPRQLGRRGFDPASLCLYLAGQYRQPGFAFDEFDPSRVISWTEGRWLDSDRPVLLPALPTFFNYRAPRGEQFCQVTSNGLAAGASESDAAVRATLELIERDTFMMTWLQRRPADRLVPGPELGDRVLDVLTELAELGMPATLYLLRGDIAVPTVMCVTRGDGRCRPAAAVALAAHPDPIEAARRAVLEQAHVGPYVARLMANPSQEVPRRATEVRSLNDHALFYTPRQRLRSFAFLESDRRRPIPLGRLRRPTSRGREACVAALAAAGLRVAIADVTAPDVRLGPFRVARALGTYVQPIDFGYRNRRLANPRLYRGGSDLNPDPHPLA